MPGGPPCTFIGAHNTGQRLEHSQELGLSVAYGKFDVGAAVVLSNVSVLADHNKFRLNVAWQGKTWARSMEDAAVTSC